MSWEYWEEIGRRKSEHAQRWREAARRRAAKKLAKLKPDEAETATDAGAVLGEWLDSNWRRDDGCPFEPGPTPKLPRR